MRIIRLFLAGLLLGVVSFGATARDLTEKEQLELRSDASDFSISMKRMDLQSIVQVLPPRLLDHLAKQAGLDRKGFIAAVAASIEQSLSEVTLESFEFRLEDADFSQTRDEQPFAFIPTVTILETDAARVRADSFALALQENGDWYLLTIDNPGTLQFFRQVYPQFEGVVFPTGSMEAIK